MTSLAARLVQHWHLKLLALGFAVALWVFVVTEERTQAVFTVALDVTNVPAGMRVSALGVGAVAVRVEGLRRTLERLDERELRAQLDLRSARAGQVVTRLRPQDVTVPRGVEVVRVVPAQVQATLEPVGGAR